MTSKTVRKNIFVIAPNRIGDAVLCSGIFTWIHEQYPHDDPYIYVACSPINKEIFEAIPHVTHCFEMQKLSYKRHWWNLWLSARKLKWDLIIDLRNTIISRVLCAPKKYIYKQLVKDKFDQHIHKVIENSEVVGATSVYDPKIYCTNQDRIKAQSILLSLPKHDLLIALAPGANWKGKQWRPQYFAKLIKDMFQLDRSKRLHFVLLGHESEQPIITELYLNLDQEMHAFVTNCAGQLSLRENAACLDACDLFVGNDSGLMHMAAAMNVPIVALFGPGFPEIYGPWGEKTKVIKTKISCQDLIGGADYVSEKADTMMDSIDFDEVLSACQELLALQNEGDN